MTHESVSPQVLLGKRSSSACQPAFIAYSLNVIFKLMVWLLVIGAALAGISPGLAVLCFSGGSVAALVLLLQC